MKEWEKNVKEKRKDFRKVNKFMIRVLKQLISALGNPRIYSIFSEFIYSEPYCGYSRIAHWSVCKRGTIGCINFYLRKNKHELKIEFDARIPGNNNKELVGATEEEVIDVIGNMENIEDW